MLAVATNTDPAIWERLLEEDPRMFATVLDVMRERTHGR